MLKKLSQWFTDEALTNAEPSSDEHALELATAALMMEVARSDQEKSAEELALIFDMMRSRMHLSEKEIKDLVTLAEQSAEEAHDLFTFTSLMNENFNYAQKKKLLIDLWRVAYADASLDSHESHIIRRIAGLMHVSNNDMLHARAQARPS
tara:strand:+ start:328 stop:777 length:450 start_codon:yes stop_codon:yes gene_type:complete